MVIASPSVLGALWGLVCHKVRRLCQKRLHHGLHCTFSTMLGWDPQKSWATINLSSHISLLWDIYSGDGKVVFTADMFCSGFRGWSLVIHIYLKVTPIPVWSGLAAHSWRLHFGGELSSFRKTLGKSHSDNTVWPADIEAGVWSCQTRIPMPMRARRASTHSLRGSTALIRSWLQTSIFQNCERIYFMWISHCILTVPLPLLYHTVALLFSCHAYVCACICVFIYNAMHMCVYVRHAYVYMYIFMSCLYVYTHTHIPSVRGESPSIIFPLDPSLPLFTFHSWT